MNRRQRKERLAIAILGAGLAVCVVTASASETYWDYGKLHGPASWARLSPDFALCGDGGRQSPIDLPDTISVPENIDSITVSRSRAASIVVTHQEHTNEIIDNGHTIQVSIYDGNDIRIGDALYRLRQFHFHAPSEHTIGGRHFPMEIHFVHASEDGRIAVAGVLVRQGVHNSDFDELWSILPHEPGERIVPDADEVSIHFTGRPGDVYYRYEGSLTTPPCSEDVHWFVRRAPIEMSAAQIATFTNIINNNFRPTQPLNGRRLSIYVPDYEH